MRTRISTWTAALALSIGAGPAAAQDLGEPLSAIDWLSDSIAIAPEDTLAPPPPTTAAPSQILVAPIDAPVPDRAGLIDADKEERNALGSRSLQGRQAMSDLFKRCSETPRQPLQIMSGLTRSRKKRPIWHVGGAREIVGKTNPRNVLRLGRMEACKIERRFDQFAMTQQGNLMQRLKAPGRHRGVGANCERLRGSVVAPHRRGRVHDLQVNAGAVQCLGNHIVGGCVACQAFSCRNSGRSRAPRPKAMLRERRHFLRARRQVTPIARSIA